MTISSLKPEDAAQTLEVVRWAVSAETSLELVGAGTKRGLGRPLRATHILDLSALTGIGLYEPEELVMSAAAGTPLAEIEARLVERCQQLAFEPPDYGPLLGGGAGRQTVGGVLSCNLAGPRRIKAGAARDHILGCQGISGRGEAFKAGGRVVKNVTGYDLPKLLTGAYGTLSVLTEVTVKVLPAPEETHTVVILGLDDDSAVAALTLALQSSYEVSGVAHLPTKVATRSSVTGVAGAGQAATLIRLEGFGPSIAYRAGKLREQLGRNPATGGGTIAGLDMEESLALWRELRDVAFFQEARERVIWRLSVTPAAGARAVARIHEALGPAGGDEQHFYDWGGGLIWLSLAARNGDAGAAAIRSAIAAIGGHATLIRAPEPVRAAVDVFQPQAPMLATLTARIKESLDPRRIFNPGRLYARV